MTTTNTSASIMFWAILLVLCSQTLAFQTRADRSPVSAPVRMPAELFAATISIGTEASGSRLIERQEWKDRSVSYYSKVMREERRQELGQIDEASFNAEDYLVMAKKHYFALRKIKDGKPNHAERIYRRIIDEMLHEDDCDHAQLAVTTLLLSLLLQREGHSATKTRSVFIHFFQRVQDSDEPCACSAKVLQAFALFEMKQGNTLKSLHIVHKAVQLDPSLKPVLQWKQFRDAKRKAVSRRLQASGNTCM